jgi:hypothetical protein
MDKNHIDVAKMLSEIFGTEVKEAVSPTPKQSLSEQSLRKTIIGLNEDIDPAKVDSIINSVKARCNGEVPEPSVQMYYKHIRPALIEHGISTDGQVEKPAAIPDGLQDLIESLLKTGSIEKAEKAPSASAPTPAQPELVSQLANFFEGLFGDKKGKGEPSIKEILAKVFGVSDEKPEAPKVAKPKKFVAPEITSKIDPNFRLENASCVEEMVRKDPEGFLVRIPNNFPKTLDAVFAVLSKENVRTEAARSILVENAISLQKVVTPAVEDPVVREYLKFIFLRTWKSAAKHGAWNQRVPHEIYLNMICCAGKQTSLNIQRSREIRLEAFKNEAYRASGHALAMFEEEGVKVLKATGPNNPVSMLMVFDVDNPSVVQIAFSRKHPCDSFCKKTELINLMEGIAWKLVTTNMAIVDSDKPDHMKTGYESLAKAVKADAEGNFEISNFIDMIGTDLFLKMVNIYYESKQNYLNAI